MLTSDRDKEELSETGNGLKRRSHVFRLIKSGIARWWMWAALLISPLYLSVYFHQKSFAWRVSRVMERLEDLDAKFAQANGKERFETFRAGARFGGSLMLATTNWSGLLAVGLLVLALAKLHYLFLFRPLFESDRVGRFAYFLCLMLIWLVVVGVFGTILDPYALQQNWHWSFANSLLLFSLGYSFYTSWQLGRKRQLTLLQQKTQAELDALKAQVNPHFLFNTLNNIYGTALAEDSPRTAESIHQLSGIVRYVMEEATSTRTSVERELRFIDDYVELQRMRIPRLDNIRIQVETFWDEQPTNVMPLLLNPLIENAFKYGISIQHPCFVEIRLHIADGWLRFQARNSIVPRTKLEKSTGLGLKNVQKRLELAYPGRHTFQYAPTDEVFCVDLTIRL